MPGHDAAHRCAVPTNLLSQDTRRLSIPREDPPAALPPSENRLSPQHAIIIATESVHRQSPNVAFVSDRALQKTNNTWLRLCAAIFECSYKCWHVWKIGLLCQKSRDFHIRIHAVLEFPIKLEEKFIVKEHRRVALLGA